MPMIRTVRDAMRAAVAGVSIGLVALVPTETGARGGSTTLSYRARDASRLEAMEPTSNAAHSSQTSRKPITDLIVRLSSWDGRPLAQALAAEAPGRAAPDKPTFAAELLLAAAGRIHVENRAACGPWRGETALCRTECDGGAFALVRGAGAEGRSLKLQVGRVPAIAEAGFGETVRLGSCSDAEAAGGLAARGAPAAEILLEPR